MSLVPCRSARILGGSRSLFARLAFLLLLTLPQHLAEGGPAAAAAATELRCVCLSVTPRINPKMIANLEVITAGPQCPRVEVIAKLKNQKEVCLDPEAPVMKKVIQKILDSANKKTKRNALALEKSPTNDVDPYLELRCRCPNIVTGIPLSRISFVNVFRPGVHCANVEVIATLKGGEKTCLDPNAPAIKKIVMKILEGY
ncbi:c-X-C motif chemokine 5-like protein [Cricetulus griseus]|uniref:C-X-C motif chemokine n=1 Tax=Cricetulus griseus TaxID=10029 RepID=A0A061IQ01_CRIGR|nr:c-X-C motif chemokine 5-like protein [Cricetulus griseus]